ncbi:MAG: hypothetical protein FRX49_05031 [Trebouxia sp. A1-2]|nr:MAG: hypothetical protein FRX49_05031 [Trebouxia sp. A1-2]
MPDSSCLHSDVVAAAVEYDKVRPGAGTKNSSNPEMVAHQASEAQTYNTEGKSRCASHLETWKQSGSGHFAAVP